MAIIKRKEFFADDATLNVVCGLHGNCSVAFVAELPKNAMVVNVLVDGKNVENYCLDEYRNNGNKSVVIYPRNEMFEGKTVACVYVDENCGSELYNLAFSGSIKTLAIDYISTAIANV